MDIKDLPLFRYSITGLANGQTYRLAHGQGRPTPHVTTYRQLIEKHTAAICRDTRASNPQQLVRNHLTALRAFMKFSYKSEDSIVGPELADEFDEKLSKHLTACAESMSDRSRSDRKSLLRAWKASFETLMPAASNPSPRRERHSADPQGVPVGPFEEKLKSALRAAGLTPKGAAKLAGVSTSALGRWTRGALPNTRSRTTLSKLETALKLQQDSLLECLDECTSKPSEPNAFRTRLKSLKGMKYALKASELSPELVSEWRSFLEYKTATRPLNGLKRSSRGAWTLSQVEHSSIVSTEMNSIGGGVSHTADLNWSRLATYLGFVRLGRSDGGFGQDLANVQTMAWLCVPEAVDAYLGFLTQRSAGLKHDGHRSLCSLVASVTRERYGYLRQNRRLAEGLPREILRGRDWDALCDEAYAVAEAWSASATDTSRDPAAALAFFLGSEEPLRPIFEARQRIRRLADGSTPGSMEEAVLRRDDLLLGFFTSNPLRSKNVKILTWRPDNSGHVYKNASGEWRLRIEAREFKNRGSGRAKKRKNYDVAIAKWLVPQLEAYLEQFRSVLRGDSADSGHLFLSSRTGKRMNNLNRRVFDLTRKFIPGCGGVGPHGFRHLIATVWLMKHPNDFFVVAELLNDTLQVVLKTYAHLKKDVSFAKYEAFVSAIL